jgi:hypothetical protein
MPRAVVHRHKLINSFHSLFCRRCYIYDCRHHAYRPLPSTTRPPQEPVSSIPCGEHCFKHLPANKRVGSKDECMLAAIADTPCPPVCRNMHQMRLGVPENAERDSLCVFPFKCGSCRRTLCGDRYYCLPCEDELCTGCGKVNPTLLVQARMRHEIAQEHTILSSLVVEKDTALICKLLVSSKPQSKVAVAVKAGNVVACPESELFPPPSQRSWLFVEHALFF